MFLGVKFRIATVAFLCTLLAFFLIGSFSAVADPPPSCMQRSCRGTVSAFFNKGANIAQAYFLADGTESESAVLNIYTDPSLPFSTATTTSGTGNNIQVWVNGGSYICGIQGPIANIEESVQKQGTQPIDPRYAQQKCGS
jgi:hypothetical protein